MTGTHPTPGQGGSVLVIQHEDQCPPAMMSIWLEEIGVGCEVLLGHRGDPVPTSLDGHDGLLVLGGHMSADDDADHAWLTATKALIATTTRAGMPFLGVCLGHQLGAVALGGEVRTNPAGALHTLAALDAAPEAAEDPLMSSLAPGAPILHWNGDIVTRLPEGAVRLATAPDGSVQAARFGERSWGVQFHPEVTPGQVASWTPGPDRQAELAVIEELRARIDELHRPWARLTQRFGQIVLSAAG